MGRVSALERLAVQEAGGTRVVERDLDDVEPVALLKGGRQCRVPAGCLVVDEHAAVLDIGDERQGVRAATRCVGLRPGAQLHFADQVRIREVADVPDVHALEADGHGLSVAEPSGGRGRVPRSYEDVPPDDNVALVAVAVGPDDLLGLPGAFLMTRNPS